MKKKIIDAVKILRDGGVIAYPTEAVYGLGCDPFNEAAVKKLLLLKNRDVAKGLILIASSWAQISNLVLPLTKEQQQKVFATWPGPATWIFPSSLQAPAWITGQHNSIALRVTNHPVAEALCEAFAGPIVSTSANIEGETPAKTATEVAKVFNNKLDGIFSGEVGDLKSPTPIIDVITGKILRS